MTRVIQHIKAPNDLNGNPRRLFLVVWVYENGNVTMAYDEGYAGRGAIPDKRNTAHASMPDIELPPINTTPSEYKRLLRQFAG
jgi:hypothetical protein